MWEWSGVGRSVGAGFWFPDPLFGRKLHYDLILVAILGDLDAARERNAGLGVRGIPARRGRLRIGPKRRYKSRDAVAKMARAADHAQLFEEEVLVLVGLNGLGGVPRVLAMC